MKVYVVIKSMFNDINGRLSTLKGIYTLSIVKGVYTTEDSGRLAMLEMFDKDKAEYRKTYNDNDGIVEEVGDTRCRIYIECNHDEIWYDMCEVETDKEVDIIC